MRLIRYIFLLTPFFLNAQSSLIWSNPVIVNSIDSLGYVRPKIVITKSNNVVVMWGKAFDEEIYVSTNAGNGFNTAQKITPDNMTAFVQHWGGPGIASSGDTVFIAFKAQPEDSGVVYLVKSIDGGISFSDTVRVSNDKWSRFSEVSVRPGGHPVVTYMQMDPGFHDPRYVVVNSTDGGVSFSNPSDGTVSAPGEVCDCCPAFILAQKQRTLLMFRNNDNDLRDIWATISTDGGQTFPLGADIDYNSWVLNSCPASGPHAIMENDSIYYVWMSGASGSARINIGSADLNTLNTGINTQITSPTFNAQNYPKIAGNGNNMGVSWQETRGGSSNILFISSNTGAKGIIGALTDTVNVNKAGTRGNPDIAFKDGIFHFVWQDNLSKAVMYRSAQLAFGNLEENKEAFDLYPNPAGDYIIFKTSDKTDSENIKLFDSQGNQLSFSIELLDSRWKLNLSGMKPGTYFLRFPKADKIISRKLIIK